MKRQYAFGIALLLGVTVVTPAQAQESAKTSSALQASWRLWPAPELRIEGDNGWYMNTRGRFEMDAVSIRDDAGSHTGGVYDRRARLGFEAGKGDWSFSAEWDFSDHEEVEYTDVALEYDDGKGIRWQIGNFKEIFGMERTGSSTVALFMERAAVDVLTPRRSLGVQATRYGERGTVSLGAFTESFHNTTNKADAAVTGRATYSWTPVQDSLLHLGVSASHRNMEKIGFSASPAETASTSLDAVSVPTLYDVDTMVVAGVEAGYSWKNTLLRGEYITSYLDRDAAADATLYGWYMQASWLLTGEDYAYSAEKNALFQAVNPARPLNLAAGDWGAWELGARYQVLSLNDGSLSGGMMQVATAGVNWYPDTHWRITSEVSYVNTDAEAVIPHDNPIVMGMRARVVF